MRCLTAEFSAPYISFCTLTPGLPVTTLIRTRRRDPQNPDVIGISHVDAVGESELPSVGTDSKLDGDILVSA